MSTLEKWLKVPAIPGFDAVKEGRRWKREAARDRAGMTSAQERAYLDAVVKAMYSGKPQPNPDDFRTPRPARRVHSAPRVAKRSHALVHA